MNVNVDEPIKRHQLNESDSTAVRSRGVEFSPQIDSREQPKVSQAAAQNLKTRATLSPNLGRLANPASLKA